MMGVMLVLIFWLMIPWLWELKRPLWPFYAAAFFIVTGLVLPIVLKPIHRLWMMLGTVLGWINQRLILGLIFYVFILPMGLVLKLLRRDALSRKLDKTTASYRIPSQQLTSDNLNKPY